jgi:hypothetical protein
VADDLEARIQEVFAATEQEREDEQKRKWNVWTVLFTVIAVILAIEIAILGIAISLRTAPRRMRSTKRRQMSSGQYRAGLTE